MELLVGSVTVEESVTTSLTVLAGASHLFVVGRTTVNSHPPARVMTATQATENSRLTARPGGSVGPWQNHKGYGADALTVAARLPYAVLHCAALHASNDETKNALHYIDIRTVGDKVRVAATDGHRLFRMFIPVDHVGVQCPTNPLAIDPAMFKKAPTKKTVWACLFSDGLATAGSPTSEQNRKASEVLTGTWRSDNGCYTFPEVDQLVPDKFSNAPGRPIAFNARYFNDVMKLAQKFTANNVVKQEMNAPHTPMVFSFTIEEFWLGGELVKNGYIKKWSCDSLTAEVLIMPVQIRD